MEIKVQRLFIWMSNTIF
ncbi:hypothetical protein NPI32_002021, partial [Escherichia coli]